MMKCLIWILFLASLSCATKQSASTSTENNSQVLSIEGIYPIGKTAVDQEIPLGGLSGLAVVKKNEKLNEYELVTLTDRGPNSHYVTIKEQKFRPFLFPKFTPRILHLIYNDNKNTVEVVSETKFFISGNTKMTGLPNKSTDESPVDLKGNPVKLDPNGYDTESIGLDSKSGYWIGEEYGPSISQVSSSGVIIKRLLPGDGLPALFAKRQHNGGFEGIATSEKFIYGILQKPIIEGQRLIRIVQINAETLKTSGVFAYLIDSPSSDRIGDMAMMKDGRILVLEQDGKTSKDSFKKVFIIDFAQATNLYPTHTDDFKEMTDAEFSLNKLVPVKKILVSDLSAEGLYSFQKIEGMTILNDSTLAFVNDNDFTLNGSVDLNSGLVPIKDEKSYFMTLKLKKSLVDFK